MKTRGFTFTELAISLAILAVIVLVVGGISHSCIANYSGASQNKATDEARAYANELHLKADSISCMGYDTDGDGYISCTISTLNEKGEAHLTPVECAAAFSWNAGCKMQRTAR